MLLAFLVLGPILLGMIWFYGIGIILVGALLLVPPAIALAITVFMERIGFVRRWFYWAKVAVLLPFWLAWPLVVAMPAFAPHWMRVVSGLVASTWHGGATVTAARMRNGAFVQARMLHGFVWDLKSLGLFVASEYAFMILDDLLAYLMPSDALPIRARCDQRLFHRRDGREKGKAIRWYSEPLDQDPTDSMTDGEAEKAEPVPWYLRPNPPAPWYATPHPKGVPNGYWARMQAEEERRRNRPEAR